MFLCWSHLHWWNWKADDAGPFMSRGKILLLDSRHILMSLLWAITVCDDHHGCNQQSQNFPKYPQKAMKQCIYISFLNLESEIKTEGHLAWVKVRFSRNLIAKYKMQLQKWKARISGLGGAPIKLNLIVKYKIYNNNKKNTKVQIKVIWLGWRSDPVWLWIRFSWIVSFLIVTFFGREAKGHGESMGPSKMTDHRSSVNLRKQQQ